MSHKILHFTQSDGERIALLASSIIGVAQQHVNSAIMQKGNNLYVREPYDQVLRMWADALSEQS